MSKRIYLATSWRNEFHADVLKMLRGDGYQVYDFKNPAPNNTGFKWTEAGGPAEEAAGDWPFHTYQRVMRHPVAQASFLRDKAALDLCEVCVLVLPAGISAHLELGYAAGANKFTAVLCPPTTIRPELMYGVCDLVTNGGMALLNWLSNLPRVRQPDRATVGTTRDDRYNIASGQDGEAD